MLPPHPSFLPVKPADALEPDLTIYPDPPPEAGPSRHPLASSSTECQICSSPFKYTCPRCSTRTCSLPCIKTHKSQSGCTGTRDPTRFVTLSEFGQGDWGGDYAYLESGRRKIADWGKDLPSQPGRGDENVRGGRGGRLGGNGGKRGPSKVEGLKRELERRGVEVEFMAEGMGRRKLNQSSWNPKTQTLYLTVQFQIPQSLHGSPTTEVKTINHLRTLYTTPTSDLPTLSSLIPPPLDPKDVVILLPFHPSYYNPTPIDILLRQPRPKLYYQPLRADTNLEDTFRGMSWVEFPVLQVFSKEEWQKKLDEGSVAVVPLSQGERGEKRKFDTESIPASSSRSEPRSNAGAIGGEEKKVKVQTQTQVTGGGLAGLGEYDSASEGEVEDETAELGSGNEDEMEITQEDVAVLHALGAAAAADMT